MSRKYESITLSLNIEEKTELEKLAHKLGYLWGEKPSISALIAAISTGEIELLEVSEHPAFALWSQLDGIENYLASSTAVLKKLRDTTRKQKNDWSLEQESSNLLIYGPNHLEIQIRDFDPNHAFDEQLHDCEAQPNTTSISYPLDNASYLQAVVASKGKTSQGFIHVGNNCSWRSVNPAFVKLLQNVLIGKIQKLKEV